MRLLFLIDAALASTSYLFQWINSKGTTTDCDFAPSLVYGFAVSDPLKTTRMPNETWPAFANAYAPFYPVKSCGQLTTRSMTDICCISILTPKLYSDISSVALIDVETVPTDSSTLFPKFMNGQQYCKLANLGSVFAYRELYIKADEECYDVVFKCYQNNTLRIYPAQGCKGTPTTFDLSSTPQTFSHQYTSSFQGSAIVISQANARVGYTQIVPAMKMTLSNKELAEILAAIIYPLLILAEALTVGYYSYRYYKFKKSSVLILISSHVSWLVFICILISYNYIEFLNESDMVSNFSAWSIFYALGNLFTAMFTANHIASIWGLSAKKKYLLYTLVLVINLAFMGGYFLRGIIYPNDGIMDWASVGYPIWTILLFIFDLVPIVATIIQFTPGANADWVKEAKQAFVRDIPTTVIFSTQFAIALGFITNEIARNTGGWGNDRNYQASRAFSAFCVLFHSWFSGLYTFFLIGGV